MDKRFVIGIVAATLIILSGGVYLLQATGPAKSVSSSAAKLEAGERSYEWGQINYSGGDVSKSFKIKNTGTETLRLYNIKTSCTCTKAFVSINGDKSPAFSMHTTSGWVGEVKPGEEATLEVVFDPDFHGPFGVGPITRLISVETNDKDNPKLEFTLTGNVVK